MGQKQIVWWKECWEWSEYCTYFFSESTQTCALRPLFLIKHGTSFCWQHYWPKSNHNWHNYCRRCQVLFSTTFHPYVAWRCFEVSTPFNICPFVSWHDWPFCHLAGILSVDLTCWKPRLQAYDLSSIPLRSISPCLRILWDVWNGFIIRNSCQTSRFLCVLVLKWQIGTWCWTPFLIVFRMYSKINVSIVMVK